MIAFHSAKEVCLLNKLMQQMFQENGQINGPKMCCWLAQLFFHNGLCGKQSFAGGKQRGLTAAEHFATNL